jgi:hypothetical protein
VNYCLHWQNYSPDGSRNRFFSSHVAFTDNAAIAVTVTKAIAGKEHSRLRRIFGRLQDATGGA